jgi:phage tail-like protein
MSKEFKFRVLTEEDWKSIHPVELAYDKEGGALELKTGRDAGTYISAPLDSGLENCRWHRVRLEAGLPAGALLSCSFFTANIKSPGKEEWTGTIEFQDGAGLDALVHAPPGRYITIKISFHRDAGSPQLKRLFVYYPRQSYLRYLPAVYQGEKDKFAEHFLSLFETLLYDNELRISNLPSFIDPMSTPPQYIDWLAQWLSLDLYELLGEKNREFILLAAQLYKQKGTPAGIINLMKLLTGKECKLKEYMNNVFYTYGPGQDDAGSAGAGWNGEPAGFKPPVSRTVNSLDWGRIGRMGRFEDDTHYSVGTGPTARYSPHTIGLYIFLSPEDREFIIRERELHKIIDSFLPIFVRAEINLVEEIIEIYETGGIAEGTEYWWDVIHASDHETARAAPDGYYIDRMDIEQLYTVKPGAISYVMPKYLTPSVKDRVSRRCLFTWSAHHEGRTNQPESRTYHAAAADMPAPSWLTTYSPARHGSVNQPGRRTFVPYMDYIEKEVKI